MSWLLHFCRKKSKILKVDTFGVNQQPSSSYSTIMKAPASILSTVSAFPSTIDGKTLITREKLLPTKTKGSLEGKIKSHLAVGSASLIKAEFDGPGWSDQKARSAVTEGNSSSLKNMICQDSRKYFSPVLEWKSSWSKRNFRWRTFQITCWCLIVKPQSDFFHAKVCY